MSAARQLAEGLDRLAIALSHEAHEALLAYAALLAKWNHTYSLTALHGEEKAVSHHLLDSLAILPYVPVGELLDVGSGGGMPGIPLAIAAPERQVALIDSNSKKAAFLRQAAIELALPNISVHCGRVEQYHLDEGFAVIVSRAFADLADFVRLTRHLLRAGGVWLAMKGVASAEEIRGLPEDIVVKARHRLEVPGVAAERHVLVLCETSEADEKTQGEN